MGNLQWGTNQGGSKNDIARSIDQTADGGYIIAGSSESSDGDVSKNKGMEDYWIVKLDASGRLVWESSLGGSENDFAYAIEQTVDEEYAVAGSSNSSDRDVIGNNGLLIFGL